MGYIDHLMKSVFEDSKIFADAFNNFLFKRRQRILPEELESLNPKEILCPQENKKRHLIRERDLLKMAVCKRGEKHTYLILGIEGQSYLDVSMTVRTMLYDAINYNNQVEELRQKNREEGILSPEDVVSGLRPTDKIKPVITLVVFLSDQSWTVGRSLHDFLDVEDRSYLKFVPNYKLNLISPFDMTDKEILRFRSDLRALFLSAKYALDKKKLLQLMREHSFFKRVKYQAACLIREITHFNLTIKKKEMEVNMSEKVETLSEFCLRLGREEGMQTGRQEGIREGEIIGSIKTLLSLKKSKEEICQYLEKNLNLSPNDALKEVSLLAH